MRGSTWAWRSWIRSSSRIARQWNWSARRLRDGEPEEVDVLGFLDRPAERGGERDVLGPFEDVVRPSARGSPGPGRRRAGRWWTPRSDRGAGSPRTPGCIGGDREPQPDRLELRFLAVLPRLHRREDSPVTPVRADDDRREAVHRGPGEEFVLRRPTDGGRRRLEAHQHRVRRPCGSSPRQEGPGEQTPSACRIEDIAGS